MKQVIANIATAFYTNFPKNPTEYRSGINYNIFDNFDIYGGWEIVWEILIESVREMVRATACERERGWKRGEREWWKRGSERVPGWEEAKCMWLTEWVTHWLLEILMHLKMVWNV